MENNDTAYALLSAHSYEITMCDCTTKTETFSRKLLKQTPSLAINFELIDSEMDNSEFSELVN